MDDFTLDGLTDEERKRFLESFAPGPVATGPVTRGAGGFSPLPVSQAAPAVPTWTEGVSSRGPSPEEEEADFMRRFVAAQRRGETLDALNALGHGFGADASLIAGTGVNTVTRDTSLRNRDVDALMARRGVEQQRRAQQRQQTADAVALDKTRAETEAAQARARATSAEEAREAALADPKSPESVAMRATATELLKGRLSPDALASMSGVQIRDALRFGTSAMNAEALAGYRGQMLDIQQQNAASDRALRAEALRQGWDIAQLTADQREYLAKFEAEQREKLAKLEADARIAASEREHAIKMEEREVGGFDFYEGRTPSLDSAKKMADVAKQSMAIKRALTNLRDLYSKHGTELFGKYAGDMESEFGAITTALRILREMGVPNGRDYEMLEKEIADPTTWRDLFTSKGRNLSKMNRFSQRIDDTVSDTAYVYGYRPTGNNPPAKGERPVNNPKPGPTPEQGRRIPQASFVVPNEVGGYRPLNAGKAQFQPSGKTAPAGKVLMFNPKGAEFAVPESMVEKSTAKGWKVVK